MIAQIMTLKDILTRELSFRDLYREFILMCLYTVYTVMFVN